MSRDLLKNRILSYLKNYGSEASIRHISNELNINPRTASKYLYQLAELNKVKFRRISSKRCMWFF